jgi:hypothetical protein
MAKRPPLPTIELRSKLEVARSELYEGIESRFNLLFYRYQEDYNPFATIGFPHSLKIDRTNIPSERMPATFGLQLRGYCVALFDAEAAIRLDIAPDETVLLEWLDDRTPFQRSGRTTGPPLRCGSPITISVGCIARFA